MVANSPPPAVPVGPKFMPAPPEISDIIPPGDTTNNETAKTAESQMVFKSESSSCPQKRISKAATVKIATARLKARKSTPAPPTKGGGRKRFILSPTPEDKQLRKRIEFATEEDVDDANPACKLFISFNKEKTGEALAANESNQQQPERMEEVNGSNNNFGVPRDVAPVTELKTPAGESIEKTKRE